MTEKKLSTLGYLMDRLGLSTAGLARRLHVDASLVSKWRSGNRRLHVKSVYFEDICEMFLEQDRAALCDALRSLIPLEEAKAPMDTAILLRRVLTDRHFTVPRAFTLRTEAVCTAEIAVYTSTEGRRQAISDLLDVAEAMEEPGEMLYVDSEQSRWLLEDTAYARTWVRRMLKLLDRGFTFRAALHFSVSVDRFVSFFQMCSPLIFHRNAHWYYHQYYDENIYWFSFFILEHAMSVTRMSMATDQTSTTVFTDAYSILQHRNVFHMVLTSCRPMFTELTIDMEHETISGLDCLAREGEKLLSYLPAPAFMTVEESLMNDILQENGISGLAALRCRQVNRFLRRMTQGQLEGGHPAAGRGEEGCLAEGQLEGGGLPTHPPGTGEEIIQILQLGEMKRRIRTRFVSTSLSLICGRQVVISPLHYARGLEELAGRMEQFPSYRLFLADGTDDICLPDINCWCHGTSWMVQMDAQGFRVCRESTLSGAAYITLEQGWRRVPPACKDRDAVLSVLRSLIGYIKDCFL